MIDVGLVVWSGDDGLSDFGILIVCGCFNLLVDLDVVEDLEWIKLLFDDLENKKDLI